MIFALEGSRARKEEKEYVKKLYTNYGELSDKKYIYAGVYMIIFPNNKKYKRQYLQDAWRHEAYWKNNH